MANRCSNVTTSSFSGPKGLFELQLVLGPRTSDRWNPLKYGEDADLTTLGFGDSLCSMMSSITTTTVSYKTNRVLVHALMW